MVSSAKCLQKKLYLRFAMLTQSSPYFLSYVYESTIYGMLLSEIKLKNTNMQKKIQNFLSIKFLQYFDKIW